MVGKSEERKGIENMLTYYLSSLGCAKNQVDSEMMLGILSRLDYQRVEQPEIAEIIIINTCGFIADAKEESIQTILELARFKETGSCHFLVVTGCLVEKYRQDLAGELPEVDGWLGTKEYHRIGALLAKLQGVALLEPYEDIQSLYAKRELLTPPYTAYMKIAEGCNNRCAYCLIPQLRGALHSVPLEVLLAEAAHLKATGVEEILLIAQDTSNYGRDLYGKEMLPELLAQVAQLGFTWVRLLYCYPTRISPALLKVMAHYPNICHYLDIPLQHVSDKILHAMGRYGGRQEIDAAFRHIRIYLPDAAIRTTFMVGFPGETEEDFQELLDFVHEAGIAWAGVFRYSPEDDTPAARMPEQVPEEVKAERQDRLMAELAAISRQHKKSWLGQSWQVLLEEEVAPGIWACRSQYQAPEVDGLVYMAVDGTALAGEFRWANITGSDIYDVDAQECSAPQGGEAR